MIPSSTIDFDVVKARQNGQSAVAGRRKSFVLIHLSRQIELDEPREVHGVEGPVCTGAIFSGNCRFFLGAGGGKRLRGKNVGNVTNQATNKRHVIGFAPSS
jgi:hypothetical protein